MKLIIDIGSTFYKSYQKKLGTDDKLCIISFEPNPVLFDRIGCELYKIDNNDNNDNTKNTNRIYFHKLCVQGNTSVNAIKFNIVNEQAASSTSLLTSHGIRNWKYPYGRSVFKIIDVVDVNGVTLDDYLKYSPEKVIRNYECIELLSIDIPVDVINIINSLSTKVLKATKRIIVKAFAIDYKLYQNQDELSDIIDTLRVKGFTLISTYAYSRDQEQYLEFINSDIEKDTETQIKRETDGSLSLYCK